MSCDVGLVMEMLENELALLILQPFLHFTNVTTYSPTRPSLYLRHSSFSNPSVASPLSQFILPPFLHFTYVTTHSPTPPSLYLRHSSLSNPSVASPTKQFILPPFFRFSYVTSSSFNSPGEPPVSERRTDLIWACVEGLVPCLIGPALAQYLISKHTIKTITKLPKFTL